MTRPRLTIRLASLTALAAPLYLWRFTIFSVPTNFLEILVLLTAAVWLLESPDRKKAFALPLPVAVGATVLLIGLALSAWAGGDYRTGFGIIKGWFVLPLLFGSVVRNAVTKKEDGYRIFGALFLSGTVAALWGLADWYRGNLTYDGRLKAFFLSPNQLAMFLVPAAIIGLAFSLGKNDAPWPSSRKIFSAGTAAILVALFFTYSLAAWAAFLIALAFALARSRKRYSASWKKILLSTLIVLVLLGSVPAVREKLSSFILSDRSSLASRMMIWKAAGLIGKDHPFLGIGPGRFQENYLEYQRYFPPYLEWAVPQPHSLFFAFWLESGVLGIIGFAILFSWAFRETKKQDDILRLILLAYLAYLLLHGLVDTPYWKNDLSFVFWSFLGLLGATLLPPEYRADRDVGLPD